MDIPSSHVEPADWVKQATTNVLAKIFLQLIKLIADSAIDNRGHLASSWSGLYTIKANTLEIVIRNWRRLEKFTCYNFHLKRLQRCTRNMTILFQLSQVSYTCAMEMKLELLQNVEKRRTHDMLCNRNAPCTSPSTRCLLDYMRGFCFCSVFPSIRL